MKRKTMIRNLSTAAPALCAAAMIAAMLAASCDNPNFDDPQYAFHTLQASAGTGGSASCNPSTGEAKYGRSVTVTATAANNYTFANWTAMGGTSLPSGFNASSATNTFQIYGDVNVRANFTQKQTYTVTYNGNNHTGGTVPAAQSVTAGNSVTLASQGSLVKTDHTFGGWNTNAQGTGTNYNAGASYTPTGNITLYAKWTAVGGPVGATYTETAGGVSFKMIAVEGGTFTMGCTAEQGSSDCWSDESPTSSVTLSTFYIGEFEVTQGLWQAVMGTSMPTACGSYGVGDNYPVYCVSWNDIVNDFLPRLNASTGKQYRLPTEAEWEYAARGGSSTRNYKYSGSNSIDEVAWYSSNSGSSSKQVGTKAPNELGIYDMSGNVWEWVSDWYGSYTSGAKTNPQGPTSGSNRVDRGGGWYSDAGGARVSGYRGNGNPAYGYDFIGFRLVSVSP